MSLFEDKENLKAQIVDTERMLAIVGEHPFMSFSLREKLEGLKSQLANLPEQLLEPKVKILFSGRAVFGSRGIKASVVSRAILPFEEMVKTETALVRFGNVSKRGQVRSAAKTDLYVTSLPVGSFGVELSKVEAEDLFAERDVAIAMRQVILLVKKAAESDKAFEEIISSTPQRNVANLKKFFREVATENSFIKLISGELAVELSEQSVQEAYERISGTETEEAEVFVEGVPRGILLDSGRFEAQQDTGERISGLISEELTEEELIQYEQVYLNQPCRLHLRRVHTSFKTGYKNTSFELLSISPK